MDIYRAIWAVEYLLEAREPGHMRLCGPPASWPHGDQWVCPAGPNASVHAYAAAQVKAAMDATARLGGENYVFWGGREGYHTLLNTDLKCAALLLQRG